MELSQVGRQDLTKVQAQALVNIKSLNSTFQAVLKEVLGYKTYWEHFVWLDKKLQNYLNLILI